MGKKKENNIITNKNDVIHECTICCSTDTKKCKCGGYYCDIHMKFHKDYFCKFGKRGSKLEEREKIK